MRQHYPIVTKYALKQLIPISCSTFHVPCLLSCSTLLSYHLIPFSTLLSSSPIFFYLPALPYHTCSSLMSSHLISCFIVLSNILLYLPVIQSPALPSCPTGSSPAVCCPISPPSCPGVPHCCADGARRVMTSPGRSLWVPPSVDGSRGVLLTFAAVCSATDSPPQLPARQRC